MTTTLITGPDNGLGHETRPPAGGLEAHRLHRPGIAAYENRMPASVPGHQGWNPGLVIGYDRAPRCPRRPPYALVRGATYPRGPRAWSWLGGPRTTRPARHGDPPRGRDHASATPPASRAPRDDKLAECARQMVDRQLPTLTEEQRDMLALLFGTQRGKRP